MDSRVHLPSFPSLHRIGTKHKNSTGSNATVGAGTGSAATGSSGEISTGNTVTTILSNSIPKPTPRLNSSANIISKTVSSAMNSSERPHLKLSDKLRHTNTNYGLANVNTNFEPRSERMTSTGNTLNSPSSIGFARSPKTPKPRVSSKSSGISVTVDLPTIRPGAGLKKQRNLSRINTLFGDDGDRSMNRSYSSSNESSSDSGSSRNSSSDSDDDSISGRFNEADEDEEAEAELAVVLAKESVGSPISPVSDKDTETRIKRMLTKSGAKIRFEGITTSTPMPDTIESESEDEDYEQMNKTVLRQNSVKVEELSNIESETSTDVTDHNNNDQPLFSLSKVRNGRLQSYNDRQPSSDASELVDYGHSRYTDHSKSYRHSTSSSIPVASDFFLAESSDLLNHRIKLLDDLHLNPTSSDAVIKIPKAEEITSDSARSPSSEEIPQPQTMKPSMSDMSVLTNIPNSKKSKGQRSSIDLRKYDTSDTKNLVEMSEALFEKHPTMSMKHYTKIMNRAKHVRAYLDTYYGIIEEYQTVHHASSKTGETIYLNVDGIWNPLQIMRNRRVRMRTGEKLKKFTMHGQKVGVGELYKTNGSLSNLTTVTTSSMPLENVISSKNAGLGIIAPENQDYFQYDWRKVKIASRVFSKHEKQRLIWQIGLHEIIGDLGWREGKWNELRDPSGRRWFPKYSIEMHNQIHAGSGAHHHGDSYDETYGSEHKVHRIHNLLFEDDSIAGGSLEKVPNGKKTKKGEEDHLSSSGSAESSEKKRKRISIKEVAKAKLRDKEKEKEKEREREKEKSKDGDDKDRASSLRKNDNLAFKHRFDHYHKKSVPITTTPTATTSPSKNSDQLNMPIIKIDKSPGVAAFEEGNAVNTTVVSNANSVNSNKCSSLVSDVGFYDAMDEVVEFMHLTRSINGYIERNKYEMMTKEFTVHEQLKKSRDMLTNKLADIEKLENESISKHALLLEMVEEVESEVEKHRSFTGIRANKIEELLGYCDRTNGEVNTSIALKIRNLNERADSISIQSENKVLFEYIYKIAEASIVGLLWMIWIVVELWLWCKWGVKKAVGVVKWVLI